MFVYGKRAKRPMQMSYIPELDIYQVLNPKEAQEYQQFVRIAHWIIELGKVDILYKVLLLPCHLAMPHKGNMDALMGKISSILIRLMERLASLIL